MKKYLTITLVSIVLLAVSFYCGLQQGKRSHQGHTETQTDTLVQWRVEVVEKPVFVKETVKDSILVPVVDMRTIRDTVFLPLPVTQQVFKGDYYELAVSGYEPSLDYLHLNIPTTTVISKPKQHAVYASINATAWSTFAVMPAIGYSFRTGRWEFTGMLEYNLVGKTPYVAASARFDMFTW